MAKAKRAKKPTRRPTLKKGWHETFLSTLADTGSVVRAVRAAGVHRSTAYDHREADAGFAAAWKDAERISVELMEDEARRRAVEGCRRPVFQGGKKVGEILEYSDTLLIFLLKAHDPKYRDKQQVEHSGALVTTHVYLPPKNEPPA
jgi:hypothetical protein